MDGIDSSPAMVARLREKPGGNDIAVTLGDFADVPVEGSLRLIFIVYNTLFNLLTQDDQVRCFENVAAHLTDDGAFVVEAFEPTFLARLRDDQYVDAEDIGVDEVRLDVGRHDPVSQTLDETHVSLSRDGIRLYPIVTRYAWPSELDLMARIAGLRLRERWGAGTESRSRRAAPCTCPYTRVERNRERWAGGRRGQVGDRRRRTVALGQVGDRRRRTVALGTVTRRLLPRWAGQESNPRHEG